jgi:protein-S-isoprenylcysteine O-methyltransferase Ste14
MVERILTDPWFWAFIGATGWALGFGIVGTKTLGRSAGFGIMVLILAEVPRILLPLPFVAQPRVEGSSPLLAVLGTAILVASLYFGTPVLRIIPLTGPNRQEPLRTDGLYSIVRHPLMVCDVFWPLGWSLIFGSIIGILLSPVWLLIIWVLTHVEEESLVREYGDAYRRLQSRVPRLFPGFRGFRGRHTAGH